ncbi:hypothetical protein M2323_002597 [Rhodoblastus acidophilus]|uniref:hypothetical protein n=1 Tax=Rhodoblastus acidophilus TaxID=1074 RepID=UPI002224BDD3|nr:hypothetical protein [Rhodoblastus acidophilus]MCW2284710.1 hypothetical protein [Rhodoblastus acidophilus]MCW2333663.1 hypothetical protein [Rhodoblastus acidophilus]
MQTIAVAPVLRFLAGSPEEVEVACPYCNHSHFHGAGDGQVTAHCRRHRTRGYFISGTEEARDRWGRRENPFRSDAELAQWLGWRPGWGAVPVPVLADALGDFIAEKSADPVAIRSFSREEFLSWTNEAEFKAFCVANVAKVGCKSVADLLLYVLSWRWVSARNKALSLAAFRELSA